MCGIFGSITQGKCIREQYQTALSIADQLFHRGPDDLGINIFTSSGRLAATENGILPSPPEDQAGHITLLHTRLAILDLSSSGHQPMKSEDGNYTITYNGEIYNYKELKEELIELGYTFKSDGDTEVLLNAFAAWGVECINRFSGMFAFAILDHKRKELTLARDYFGIKPLFYRHQKTEFHFSSEIPVLARLSSKAPSANHQKAYDYIVRGEIDNSADTSFANIYTLLPAQYMVLCTHTNNIKVQPTRYWDLSYKTNKDLSYNDAKSELSKLLTNSVRQHLISDIPVGAALSGGIDSSAIVCLMRKLEPDLEINTFSYIPHNQALSEQKWIDIVTQKTGARPHFCRVDFANDLENIGELIKLQGEPFISTSIYAQYKVFELARSHGIQVTLDGQGADELFAGYNSLLGFRLASIVKQKGLLKAIQFYQKSLNWPGRSAFIIAARALSIVAPHKLQAFLKELSGHPDIPRWVSQSWLKGNKLTTEAIFDFNGKPEDFLKAQLHNLTSNTRLNNLLRYADRNSMAHSVESRVPFLSREIAEFVATLPEEYLIDDSGQTKSVLRGAVKGIVPEAILSRKDKIGFTTPEKDWLTSNIEWCEHYLATAETLPLFEQPILKKELEKVKASTNYFNPLLWRCINYAFWLEKFKVSF